MTAALLSAFAVFGIFVTLGPIILPTLLGSWSDVELVVTIGAPVAMIAFGAIGFAVGWNMTERFEHEGEA